MRATKTVLIPVGVCTAALVLLMPSARSQAPAAPAQAGAAPAPGAAPGGGRGGFLRGSAVPFDYTDNDGWQSLFDGQTMKGWDGDPRFWSIKDGAIYVNPTCEKPTGTIYTIWTGGAPADFALKYELKGTGNINGGMQFRSYMTADPNVEFQYPARPARGGAGRGPGGPGGPGAAGAPGGRGAVAGGPGAPGGAGAGAGRGPGRGPACANPGTPPSAAERAKWDLFGPQADFDGNNNFSGMFYEQGGRGIISMPGHAILAEAGKVRDLGVIADKATLDSWFKKDDYNQFLVVTKGNTTSIYMNGHLTTLFIDNDPTYFRSGGKIGLEVESTGEQFARNIYLKRL